MKKILIIPIMLVLLAFFITATPNPGHDLDEIGPGLAPGAITDFWRFTGNVWVGNQLTTYGFYLPSGGGSLGHVLTANAAGVGTWQPAGAGLWQQSGSNIYYDAGNVGVGNTPDSANALRVYSPDSYGLEIETLAGEAPTIRMTQGTETWSIQHKAAYFTIKRGDEPFKIYENAPANSLVVENDGTININEKITSSSGDVIIRLGT